MVVNYGSSFAIVIINNNNHYYHRCYIYLCVQEFQLGYEVYQLYSKKNLIINKLINCERRQILLYTSRYIYTFYVSDNSRE